MSVTTFPTLILTIIGVFAALILLGSYYIFVIKCCLNWQRSETRRVSRRRMHGTHNPSLPVHSLASEESHGLDESVIKLIPTVLYRKPKELGVLHVCAVCLTEFEEEEKTRVLPNCLHFFHVDCIDEWLCKNANCPLCRSPITTDTASVDVNQEVGHVHPEINPEVVIDVREDYVATTDSTPAAGRKRSSGKWSCRGDESIELRREKQLAVRPMRRSLSADSSTDSWLSKEVIKFLHQNPHFDATPPADSIAAVPKITLPKDLQRILNTSSS